MLTEINLVAAVRSEGFRRRFWSKSKKSDGCWEWTASADRDGYGRILIPGGGPMIPAHRAAWMIAHGAIPAGLCVLHRCDTPACVRPSHLFLGTTADNNHDCMAKGRNGYKRQPGEENGRASLTEAQVVEIRARLAAGERQIDLAHEYGVCRPAISKIRNRLTWRHLA